MKLINNQDTRLYDELRPFLTPGTEVYICASFFTANALYELENGLKNASAINVLIDSSEVQDSRFIYDNREWNTYHDLRAKYRTKQTIKLVQDKCNIRSGSVGGQKFILVKDGDKTVCFSIVPQDLNLVSLGLVQSPTPVIISSFEDGSSQFLTLFTQVWNNSKRDIKAQVLTVMERGYADNSPEFLYKYSLYNLFQNAVIDEVSEQRIKKIGFKNTQIWKMLYNFQQDAVLGAIDKIETFDLGLTSPLVTKPFG